MNNLVLGVIADDFTGGSDAASFLVAGGMNTILLSEMPVGNFALPQDAEAAVIYVEITHPGNQVRPCLHQKA